MQRYGIIGYPLGHSFSAQWFNEQFAAQQTDARYDLYPLPRLIYAELHQWIHEQHICGFNVTIPYKEAILPMLDDIDEVASRIGAVNVVKVQWQGEAYRLIGYNTDYKGFIHSILPYSTRFRADRRALLLGTGGVSKAIQYALQHHLQIPYTLVSRDSHKGLTYDQLTVSTVQDHSCIVNCTPLGMAPLIDAYPSIPYEGVGADHILFDCIYNPAQTRFLQLGKQRGATIMNGYSMLVEQAKEAWKIWSEK